MTGAATARCASPPPLRDPSRGASWNGWGPTLENTHFQPAAQAGLTAEQVPRLELKWAFGFPDTTSAWAQPTVAGGRLFVGSQNGTVYSLDRKDRLRRSGRSPRTAVSEHRSRSAAPDRRSASTRVFLRSERLRVRARTRTTGTLLWSRKVDDHPLVRLTGSPALHDGRLYVPTSSYEEAGKPPGYVCCTFRGGVVALDAATGA